MIQVNTGAVVQTAVRTHSCNGTLMASLIYAARKDLNVDMAAGTRSHRRAKTHTQRPSSFRCIG